MGIGLAAELAATGCNQFAYAVEELRAVHLELLHGNTRNRESYLELLFGSLNHLQQHLGCRDIALICQALQDFFVGIIVIIVMVCTDIVETIFLQTEGLMYLKQQTNGFHN